MITPLFKIIDMVFLQLRENFKKQGSQIALKTHFLDSSR
jgi:hypothetical protein